MRTAVSNVFDAADPAAADLAVGAVVEVCSLDRCIKACITGSCRAQGRGELDGVCRLRGERRQY